MPKPDPNAYAKQAEELARLLVELDARRAGVPPGGKVEQAFNYLARCVLDPATQAKTVRAAIRANNSFSSEFRDAIGFTLAQYIQRIRAQVAERLLHATALDPVDIVYLVGFNTLERLERHYEKLTGRALRNETRHNDLVEIQADLGRLICEGRLNPTQQNGLHRLIDERHHRQASVESLWAAVQETPAAKEETPPSPKHVVDGAPQAAEVLDLIDGQPFADQREIVDRYAFAHPSLTDALRAESRRQGRQDPQRGIDYMRLAELSLENSREYVEVPYVARRAVVLAGLGNACRLALRLQEASDHLRQAERMIRENRLAGTAADAEVRWLLAALHVFEQCYEDAVRQAGRSLEICEQLNDGPGQVRALNKRAEALVYAGHLDRGEDDIQAVLKLLWDDGDVDELGSALLNLANVQMRRGQFPESRATLERLRSVAGRLLVDRGRQLLVEWVTAAVDDGEGNAAAAEEGYRRVAEGYAALGDPLSEGRARLDLAILHAGQGRSAEVHEAVTVLLPLFHGFHLGEETFQSLLLLGDAVSQEAEMEAALRRLRDALRADPLLAVARRSRP